MDEGVTRERPCPSHVQVCSSAPFLTVSVSVEQMKAYCPYPVPLFGCLGHEQPWGQIAVCRDRAVGLRGVQGLWELGRLVT